MHARGEGGMGDKIGDGCCREWGRNPSIVATETLTRMELTKDCEGQLQEREGYGGKWLNREIYPDI